MLCFHFSGGVGDTGADVGAGAATASDTDSEGMYEFSASIFQHMKSWLLYDLQYLQAYGCVHILYASLLTTYIILEALELLSHILSLICNIKTYM